MSKTATIIALAFAAVLTAGVAPASALPATTVQCGQTVTHSVKLANDLVDCPGDGLVIGASGITIDLDGHTIDGVATPTEDCDASPRGPAGIQNGAGFDDLTIKNGTLQQFYAGFNAGSATEGMADSRLLNLTARNNRFAGLTMGSGQETNNDNQITHNTVTGNGCRPGIVVNSGHGNLVAGNHATDNQGSGILICCSHDNVVVGNVSAGNGEDGIEVCCGPSAHDNLVAHNEVRDNINNGIIVFLGALNNDIRANHVHGNGDDVTIVDGPGNSVTGNVISDARGCPFCDPPTGFGIVVAADADNTTVTGNLVSHTVWDGIRIGTADLDEGSVTDGARVEGNVVRDATMDGIRVDANTAGTVLQRNAATHAGDDGLDVDGAATELLGNLALFNGDLGIEAVPGVTDRGANRARGNGNAAQCTGLACR
jgi:parallel beta-helix repeat protein